MKSTPSSVSASRTEDEKGHHSAWYSVSTSSAFEADRLVRAVAERFVAGTAATAEGRLLALVEDGAVRGDDAHAARDEQGPVRRRANLRWALSLRDEGPDATCSQRT